MRGGNSLSTSPLEMNHFSWNQLPAAYTAECPVLRNQVLQLFKSLSPDVHRSRAVHHQCNVEPPLGSGTHDRPYKTEMRDRLRRFSSARYRRGRYLISP